MGQDSGAAYLALLGELLTPAPVSAAGAAGQAGLAQTGALYGCAGQCLCRPDRCPGSGPGARRGRAAQPARSDAHAILPSHARGCRAGFPARPRRPRSRPWRRAGCRPSIPASRRALSTNPVWPWWISMRRCACGPPVVAGLPNLYRIHQHHRSGLSACRTRRDEAADLFPG